MTVTEIHQNICCIWYVNIFQLGWGHLPSEAKARKPFDRDIYSLTLWTSKNFFASNGVGVRLSVSLTEMMTSWWLISLTSGQIWADFSKIFPRGLKSLIFCMELAEVKTNNMLKNLCPILNLPEVTGWNVWPEVKKFWNRKSKNTLSESLSKTVVRVLSCFFEISIPVSTRTD